jgi:hypothetical protein
MMAELILTKDSHSCMEPRLIKKLDTSPAGTY